jgi:hypothetical protein
MTDPVNDAGLPSATGTPKHNQASGSGGSKHKQATEPPKPKSTNHGDLK